MPYSMFISMLIVVNDCQYYPCDIPTMSEDCVIEPHGVQWSMIIPILHVANHGRQWWCALKNLPLLRLSALHPLIPSPPGYA